MSDIWIAVVLGIVEGITEFLPVSSTGHLIIVGHFLDFKGDQANTFDVVIQMGAILAVVWMYRSIFAGLIFPDNHNKFSGIYGLFLLGLTTIPASIVGFLAYGFIMRELFNPYTVAWALGVGAIIILLVESFKKPARINSLNQLTPFVALSIGMFQCLALWPGFSRSASTIIGGMVMGAERRTAAEYSFITAVPIMFAASTYELYKSWSIHSSADFLVLAVGFTVSFMSACLAVKTFLYLLGQITLRPFAYYRLILAPLVILFWTTF